LDREPGRDALDDRAARGVPASLSEDFFPEQDEWGISEFVPEEGVWPPAAYERQQAAFQAGYATLREYPRGIRLDVPADRQYPRPGLSELEDCLPYFLFPLEARALARTMLALHDPRTPKDVKKALTRHMRDILRGDRLLYDARPLAPPRPESELRIQRGERRAFPGMYRDLLRLCRTTTPVVAENIVDILRQHLPQEHVEIAESRCAGLDDVLKAAIKPHLQAKMILVRLFGISESYARKRIYGR
jgi:hypothetical protein